MEEILPMRTKEITRLEIMQRLNEKRLRQKEAALQLGLRVRPVKRLWRSYRKQAAKGLISQKRGRASNHRLAAGVVQAVLDLIKQTYFDVGPRLAHEQILEEHKIAISRERKRKIMIEEAIWKPRRAKQAQVPALRERRACFGELIQIDGSEHAWFEARQERCSLLVLIDDASGQLVELRFVKEETFFAYSEAVRAYLERYGKPVAFYSDKQGVFRVNQPQPLGSTQGLTQFGRAHQTLPDRLVKELRLRNLSSIEAGNAFLPEFREDFNRRFAVPPRSTHDAHRPLQALDNLDLIFTRQRSTALSKNLTLQSNLNMYQIQTDRPMYALQHAPVTVCENAKGEVASWYKNKRLAYTTYKKLAPQSQSVDTKQLNHVIASPKAPSRDHPWRS